MTPFRRLIEAVQFALMERGLPIGTVHKWKDGQEWVKTQNGWQPKPKGGKAAKTKEEPSKPKAAAKDVATGPEKAAPKEQQKSVERSAQDSHNAVDGKTTVPGQVKTAGKRDISKAIASEPTTNPPDGTKVTVPDVTVDADGDGITDTARIGVGGRDVPPPPPKLPRLPKLTPEERAIETRLCLEYESNPDSMMRKYEEFLSQQKKPHKKVTYGTDDVKETFADWNSPYEKDEKGDPKNGKEDPAYKENRTRRGVYNLAVHQVANAIAKRAFVRKLDELSHLPEDDPKRHVLVTSGGCASGKGYALSNVSEVDEVQKACGAIWDAAGEQNATENPWVLEECRKRGLKPIFAFVDADPKTTWGDPNRGMIERAGKEGRVVDAKCFAESYAIGAKNMKRFHEDHKDDDDVGFIFLNSRGKGPEAQEEFPAESLARTADDILNEAVDFTEESAHRLNPAVLHGALAHNRLWSKDEEEQGVT